MFSNHAGTRGHKIGSAIIGKDSGPMPSDNDGDEAGGKAANSAQFSHMSVKPAANGFTVTHTPKVGPSASTHPEDPATEQAHVFRDATEAHNHIGQLLGVRMASGLQKT